MNELNKFLSSLLLLGGGFLAASFVGPPEAVDRLAHYLRPGEPSPNDGLRPLDPAMREAPALREWPELPAPAQQTPVVASAPSGTPTLPASWPASRATTDTAPNDDWLTSDTFAPNVLTIDSSRKSRLTPIPRGGQPLPAPAAAPETPESTAWPTLNPPNATAPAPEAVTARKPTLDDSPYGSRPQPETPQSAASATDWGDFGFAPAAPRLDPIDRPASAAPVLGDHIVTDGDTLALLAERYLGDASRAGELFDLNRDRLEHPDVLPIGMVLKTPERSTGLSVTPAAPAPGRSGFATLTAVGGRASFADRNAPQADHKLTPIRPQAESQRVGADALYARDALWDSGGW